MTKVSRVTASRKQVKDSPHLRVHAILGNHNWWNDLNTQCRRSGPPCFGKRYVYCHILKNDRHVVVSGVLGCTGLPVRLLLRQS